MSKSKRLASGHRFLHGICIMCGQSERGYSDTCQPVPSKVVASYIRFDNYQQPLHSWHCLQDCLEELRKIEAKQAEDSRKLSAVRAELLSWWRSSSPDIPVIAKCLAIIDQPGGEA